MKNSYSLRLTRKLPSRSAWLIAAGLILLVNAINLIVPLIVSAAPLTNAYIRLDRMKASTATTGVVAAKAATVGTEAGVRVTFPAGFTVSTTLANWAVATTSLPAGCTAWPGIAAPTNAISGQSVDFVGGDLTVGTLYCFRWTNTAALTTSTANPDKTGTITTCTTYATCSSTTLDTGNYATAVIAEDQITVTATVPATFSFTLSGTTDALGTLSTSAVTSSSPARTVTLATNASNGYIVWIMDSNAGLTSASASDTINTSGTVDDACSAAYSSGTEFYGLDADETNDPQANGTIDAEYNCTANTVGAYSTTFTELATGTGPTSGYVITLNNRAAAAAINKAATDYTDIVTVSGAGNF